MEGVLSKAGELEKKYEWLKAADLYEHTLRGVGKEDFLRRGEIQEKISYCFYRGAFQAETQEEFKSRMLGAVEAYEEAAELFKRAKEAKGSSAKILHCRAMAAYVGHWLSPTPDTKKELLNECCRLEKAALKIYDEAGDQLGFGKTCIELTNYLADRLDLELDTQMREKILDEAVSLGEKAIQIFSKIRNEHELARAYCITGIHCDSAAMSLQKETKRRECEQKAFDYAKEAIRISKTTRDKFLLCRSNTCLGISEQDLGAGTEVALEFFKKALQYGIETRDHRIISEAYDGLAFTTAWGMFLEEDLEKMREKSRKCEEYASEAISCSLLADGRGIPHSYYALIKNFTDLASREVELETRHKLLKKAVALGKQGLEHAQCSGSTHTILHVISQLPHALYYLSTMKTSIEKRQLLEESMTLGERSIHYTEQLRPHYMLPQVFPYEALALTLLELSKLEERKEKRKELLEKAVSRMETCITRLQRHVVSFPSRRELFAFLGSFQTELGNILNRLYQTTSEKKVLRKLIETYKSAVQMNKKADLVSRVAEAYWRTAVTYDRLDKYLESASIFESASKQYELSAQNIPQLNSFYMDYSTYMQAWSNIEKARHNHEKEEHSQSKEYYEKAASTLKSSKSWTYLTPNYLAWAHLEHAEDLSRDNQSQEAIRVFKEAARLFEQAKKSLEAEFDKILSADEKDMILKLRNVSNLRGEYCFARIDLEEARIFDRKGDSASSAEKYGSAAKTLGEIMESMDAESNRREINPIVLLCKAWEKMKLAEEKVDPALYAEAAELFMKSKESSLKKKSALLAAGNSHFCRALELGARFKTTRDMGLYSRAKQQMEIAASFYLDAGFKSASIWTNATQVLFDAFIYLDTAETETNPETKVRFYQIAERCLQTSAQLYGESGYTGKKNDVLRKLESVGRKRELAISLAEVLKAPVAISSTAAISAPTPTHEQAVGLERFEHADVQANLILRVREVKVGEDIDLEIELVNAGKAPALLIKVEKVVPKDFEIKGVPEIYRVEGRYLNMKGRRLEPLKTEEIRLVLRPATKGTFTLKPRIMYLDETGKYKSHEPEPVTITVKELGIRGWIKGER